MSIPGVHSCVVILKLQALMYTIILSVILPRATWLSEWLDMAITMVIWSSRVKPLTKVPKPLTFVPTALCVSAHVCACVLCMYMYVCGYLCVIMSMRMRMCAYTSVVAFCVCVCVCTYMRTCDVRAYAHCVCVCAHGRIIQIDLLMNH